MPIMKSQPWSAQIDATSAARSSVGTRSMRGLSLVPSFAMAMPFCRHYRYAAPLTSLSSPRLLHLGPLSLGFSKGWRMLILVPAAHSLPFEKGHPTEFPARNELPTDLGKTATQGIAVLGYTTTAASLRDRVARAELPENHFSGFSSTFFLPMRFRQDPCRN